jgi:hypothetical protein
LGFWRASTEAGTGGLRSRREITHQAVGADLVLDLHHQHGALDGIDLLQVAHQRDEGALVGLQRLGAEGAEAVVRLAFAVHVGREALGVELDPWGGVLCAGVLPGAEPQHHQALLLLAGLLDQRVDEGEIELALLRLHLLPGHRHQHGVGLEVVGGGPDGAERRGVVAGVVRLRAEDEEGLAVHEQGVAAVFGGQAWELGGASGVEQTGQSRSEERRLFHRDSDVKEQGRRPRMGPPYTPRIRTSSWLAPSTGGRCS